MTGANHIAFVDREQIRAASLTLAVELSGPPAGSDLALVLDIYDLDKPVHPEGHLGWWKFDIEGASGRLELSLDGQVARLDGRAPEGSWVNPAFQPGRGAIFNAVLRSQATNAILHLDRIPVMADAGELQKLRAAVDRDWSRPRYAPAHFLPQAGQTVHIALPSLILRDAVGNYALELYRLLRQNRIAARLYASDIDLPVNDMVQPYEAIARQLGPADQLLYFYSTHDPLLPQLVELPVEKVAYFHGVTAPDKLRVFDPELSVSCTKALAGLPLLKRFNRLAANSRHSAGVLAKALDMSGSDRIAVIPPRFVPLDDTPARGGNGRSRALLSVSQLSPHKRIEDVLRLFAACREHDPDLRCWIVGRPRARAYSDYLSWVETSELGLPAGAVRWFGSVSDGELVDLYRTAAAYISMSEDEGFGVPLFEAMRHGLPVFAYGQPAAEETLGGAGVSFTAKDFPHLAEAIVAALADAPWREAMVRRGERRAAELAGRMDGAELLRFLRPAAGAGR